MHEMPVTLIQIQHSELILPLVPSFKTHHHTELDYAHIRISHLVFKLINE